VRLSSEDKLVEDVPCENQKKGRVFTFLGGFGAFLHQFLANFRLFGEILLC